MAVSLVGCFLVHYRVQKSQYLESEKLFIVFYCLCAVYTLLYLILFLFVMIKYKLEQKICNITNALFMVCALFFIGLSGYDLISLKRD